MNLFDYQQEQEKTKEQKPETFNVLNDLLFNKETNNKLCVDSVVMNPPYSMRWEMIEDERFTIGLAPKSRADFAFLLHGFHTLTPKGKMAILLPHGVLFRGGIEEKIRKKLLQKKHINAIIGLPNKLFLNTQIPTCIIILTKKENENVLFIDASEVYVKEKALNILEDDGVDIIVSAIQNRVEVEKFCSVVGYDEIKTNDYNLNIPRYVDTYEKPESVDEHKLLDELEKLEKEIKELQNQLAEQFSQLVDSREDKTLLPRYIKYFSKKGEENE